MLIHSATCNRLPPVLVGDDAVERKEEEELLRKPAADSRRCTCLGSSVGGENRLHPAADARGDGLLGGAAAFADALRRGLDGVCGLERLDLFGEFGNARLRFAVLLRSRAGKAGLELVAQGGQLGQVGVVEEGLAEARLVVAKLGLRDGEVLPDAGAFRAVAVWPGVPAAFRTARGPWCSRESMDWRVVAPSRYTSGANCGCRTRPKRRPR